MVIKVKGEEQVLVANKEILREEQDKDEILYNEEEKKQIAHLKTENEEKILLKQKSLKNLERTPM